MAHSDHRPAARPPAGRAAAPRRGTRERRRAILAAAERLFAEQGYVRTSMKEIAGALGITDAALYRHFESKREILEMLYEERGFFRAMEVLERLPGTRDAASQFRLNALASADLWAANAGFLRIVLMESLAGDEMAAGVHRGLMERWRAGVRRLFAIYASRDELDPVRAARGAEMLVDFLFGVFMDRLLAMRPGDDGLAFSEPAFRTEITDGVALLVDACRPPPGEAGGPLGR